MIAKSYAEYIKTQLSNYVYDKGETMSFDVHHEFYYRDVTIDCDVTTTFLEGTIQQKINRQPILTYIEVDEKHKDLIYDYFFDFALTKNETLITLDSKQYRQYYNTPIIGDKFIDNGYGKRVIITLNSSIIPFSNVLGIKTLYLENNSKKEQIPFITTALSYLAQLMSDGGTGGSSVVHQTANTSATTYQFSFVPTYDLDVCKKLRSVMMSNSIPNEAFKMYLTFDDDIGNVIDTICQSITYTQDSNGFPIMTIMLVRK